MSKEEWLSHAAEQRAIDEASPDFLARRERIRILSQVIGEMLYPPGPDCSESVYRGGRIVDMAPPAKPIQANEYPCNAGERVGHLLAHYIQVYRDARKIDKNKRLSRDRESTILGEVPPSIQGQILEAHEAAKWPYKLGASLYVHQQMAARNKVSEPSQGKAQFLVAKAPIRNFQPEGIVPLRPDGGEPSKIGDQWRRYFQVAHYWAAFVVWTKSPLICPTDRFALIDFVARAEPDEFFSNAAAFRRFRVTQPITRRKGSPFFKQGLDTVDRCLEEAIPTAPLKIRDFLKPYQWAALKHYKTRPRA